jgi:three-Cys-motif partner protein
MVGIDESIWDLDPHTKAKHQILEEYLKRWFPILGSTAGRIVYLDGFAGPGIYSKGEEGSPVIALKTAVDHKLTERFQKIVFWFIEKDQDRSKNLEQILKQKFPNLPSNIQYEVEKTEFADGLENTLNSIEREGAKLAPTFAFIDPFGFSGMPMDLLVRLLGYQRCEVLITFMSSFILRFNDERRENALDELYGTKNWRKLHELIDPDAKRRFLVDLYAQQLRNVGGAEYLRTFEMIGDNNQTIYHLIFATKSLKGLEAMKEAMMKVDRRGTFTFSDRTDPKQTFLLDYGDESDWIFQAAELVFNRFKGKIISVDEVVKCKSLYAD